MSTTAIAATPRSNAVFAAVVSGAYASAATALLFLLMDLLRGEPQSTPSLLGSVVLLGESPASVTSVRLDMVALYSLVHLVAFVLIGALATAAYVAAEAIRTPVLFGGLLLAGLSVGVFAVDAVFFPGLIAAIGVLPLLAGNLTAAATMTWVIRWGVDGPIASR